MWDVGEYERVLSQCRLDLLGDEDMPIVSNHHARLRGYFAAMRTVYGTSLHKFVLDPIRREFKTLCMRATLENLASRTFDDEVEKHMKISEIYQHNCNRGVIRYSHDAEFAEDGSALAAEQFRVNLRSADAVRPRIAQVVQQIYSDMCVWVAGLQFKDHKVMMGFLDEFETDVAHEPFNFHLGWPKDVFATFRAEFIMREDVSLIKFPPSQEVALRSTGRSLFPVETLVSITYTDDEQAMRKWLQVAIRWSCESEGTCCIFDSIDHCVMNNAVKCILCITKEIFDKHLIKSNYGESEWWVKSTFTYMLQQALENNQRAQTRSFGYVGPMRWDKMTPAFLKAAYRHPLAMPLIGAEVGVPLVLPPVPLGMPLRSMWVRVVRWSRVRAFVNARSAIVYMMKMAAERQCRAEFAEDGSALLLGDLSRSDRVAYAVTNGVEFQPLNHGRAPIARGATASFNLALQRSMELIEKSRLERAEARAAAQSSSDSEGPREEGEEPSPKRARVVV
jgi:hypothetical protein